VLAEDGALMRVGLTALLGRFGHQVVAEASDAAQLIEAATEHRPDIVVTDVRMPPGFSDEGLRAAVELRTAIPGLAVLVLSQLLRA
jgi:DNA-binding NarL/FixJ family response regulator